MPLPYTFPFTFGADTVDNGSGLEQLLPPGAAFLLEPGSNVWQTLLALSDELGRVRGRGQDLLAEMDPRTATETLPDWEKAVGLPDEIIVQIPTSPEARRLAITQKLVRRGGQNAAYYIAKAAACGYTVTVTDNFGASILRAGFLAGARCYGASWAYSWGVTVQVPAGPALTHAQLEAAIRKDAPAHTTVFFTYL